MSSAPEPDELELLTDFFYIVPIGLMRFQADGTVTLMNPMVPRLLLPRASGAALSNAYTAFGTLIPDLAQRLNKSPEMNGVIIDHERHAATAGSPRLVLSITISRVPHGSSPLCRSSSGRVVSRSASCRKPRRTSPGAAITIP